MLSRRQINVQRDNLVSMCRISVKALLDYACLYTHVDDECEEFINFCAVFEQMVSHRLRPNQKKAWLPGPASPRHFWDLLMDIQTRHQRQNTTYFQSCLPNIDAIESFKTPTAKLRAFIRVALMEKRLSDYVMWILDHQDMLRHQYFEGAVMVSEQASVLCGDMIGLNAIDFNFCLKGNENEFLGPLEISYSRFLRYKQTAASRNSDEIEMLRLNRNDEDDDEVDEMSGQSSKVQLQAGSVLTEGNVNDMLRLQQLERDFRSIKEQKDYLEELIRLRERQVGEANARLGGLRTEFTTQQKEWERERHTMDSCILELQADITKLYQQNERQRFQLASFKQFKERLADKEVQLDNMALLETSTKQAQPQPTASSTPQYRRQGSQLSSDSRGFLSSISSDQSRFTTGREDSQSMVPLTGSLADVNIAMLDPDSRDAVRKHMSQWEMEDDSKDAAEEAHNALTISAADPIIAGHGQEPVVVQAQGAQGGKSEVIMMESFVMTEDKKEIEQAVRQAIEVHGGDGDDIVDIQVDVADGADAAEVSVGNDNRNDEQEPVKSLPLEDEGVIEYDDLMPALGLDQETQDSKGEETSPSVAERAGDVSGTSDIAILEPEEQVVFSEPEELVATSDPEVIDQSNTSGDSSDGAWDMMSDSENVAEGEGKADNA